MITSVSLAASGQRLSGSLAAGPVQAEAPAGNPQHRFSASHNGVAADFWAEGAIWKAQVWELLVPKGIWASDSVEELFQFVFRPGQLAR